MQFVFDDYNQSLEQKATPEFSVAEFNNYVNTHLSLLKGCTVKGEVTQLNITPKGGVNIVIKDTAEQAVLNLSGYAPRISGLKAIEVGMSVRCVGTPQIWSAGGRFSLAIDQISPLGEGSLKRAYELLKAKLAAEGIFDVDHKLALPSYLTKIALITAKDSAAQSDFLKILRENGQGIEIDFYPVQVQGKFAIAEIRQALKAAAAKNYDAIVLTRGGGSLEDLIAFNDEDIARDIASLRLPVIVAVGHERDESIADFAADVRASTPSQAAYYIISINAAFISKIEKSAEAIYYNILSKISQLERSTSQKLYGVDNKIHNQIALFRMTAEKAYFACTKIESNLQNFVQRVSNLQKLASSHDPKRILSKGYTIFIKDKKVIKSVDQIKNGDTLNAHFADGDAKTQIISINKKS